MCHGSLPSCCGLHLRQRSVSSIQRQLRLPGGAGTAAAAAATTGTRRGAPHPPTLVGRGPVVDECRRLRDVRGPSAGCASGVGVVVRSGRRVAAVVVVVVVHLRSLGSEEFGEPPLPTGEQSSRQSACSAPGAAPCGEILQGALPRAALQKLGCRAGAKQKFEGRHGLVLRGVACEPVQSHPETKLIHLHVGAFVAILLWLRLIVLLATVGIGLVIILGSRVLLHPLDRQALLLLLTVQRLFHLLSSVGCARPCGGLGSAPSSEGSLSTSATSFSSFCWRGRKAAVRAGGGG
mmetsp:Transcript_30735/g.102360  ORF Transcript_30735/g.102360 Transcript_30735/m.102360 type:complete len:292 (+) Transcript_30735:137-1012(+)